MTLKYLLKYLPLLDVNMNIVIMPAGFCWVRRPSLPRPLNVLCARFLQYSLEFVLCSGWKNTEGEIKLMWSSLSPSMNIPWTRDCKHSWQPFPLELLCLMFLYLMAPHNNCSVLPLFCQLDCDSLLLSFRFHSIVLSKSWLWHWTPFI